MKELIELFGKKIKTIRKKKKMTQENLAELSKLSIQYIGEIERGVRNPSLSSIDKIARALEMPVEELFDLEEYRMTIDDIRELLLEQIKNADEEKLYMFYSVSKAVFK